MTGLVTTVCSKRIFGKVRSFRNCMIDKVNDQKDKMGAVMKKDDIVKVTI